MTAQPMTKAEYHAHRSISGSVIRKAYDAPAAAWEAIARPTKSTKAMDFGTASHLAFLEPHHFDENVFVRPDGSTMRGNEGERYKAASNGRPILKQDEAAKAHELAARAMRYLQANYPALADRSKWVVETPIITTHDGFSVRCMPDALIRVRGHFFNLSYKTARDASREAWTREVISSAWSGYDIGEAHYRRCIAAAHKCDPKNVHTLHLVVCTGDPSAGVYELGEDVMDRADAILDRLYPIVQRALDTADAPTCPDELSFMPPAIVTVARYADAAGSAVQEIPK